VPVLLEKLGLSKVQVLQGGGHSEPGNPNACGCSYWPWPGGSSPPAADESCTCRNAGPGPSWSPPAINAWPPSPRPANPPHRL